MTNAIQLSLDSLKVKRGDVILVEAHTYDNGELKALYRPFGRYRILFVFENGAVFARFTEGNREPQVIPTAYILQVL